MRLLRQESVWIGESEVTDDELVIAVTREELATLSNGVLESLGAIDEWEYDTRVGGTPHEARALLGRIGDILAAAYHPE